MKKRTCKFYHYLTTICSSKILNATKNRTQEEQKGMALIMTLGILSMLLVLALAFVSNARTTRKIASSNANTTRAKLIAEGALDRILALAKLSGNNPAGTTSVNPDGDSAFNYSGSGQKYNDFLANISMNDIIGTEIYTYDETHPVEWINLSSDGKVLGRFAYVVIGNAGKIDPSVAVTHDADVNANFGVPGAQDEDPPPEERFGVHTYEMNIGNLDPTGTAGVTATNIKKFSSDAAPAGQLPDGGRWTDYSSMFTAVGIGTASLKKLCERDWLILDAGKDPEAFWVDTNTDGVKDVDSELFHRFNLRQFTDVGGVLGVYEGWVDNNSNGIYDGGDTIGIDTNWWDIATVASIVGSNRAAWDSAHTSVDATGGINWLNDVTNLPQETFGSPGDRQSQIVANLIDYCDTDNIPTSDVNPASWSNTAPNIPTYTGNELTQYINEVYCTFSATQSQITDSSGSPTTKQNKYVIQANLHVELVDMYTAGVLPDPDIFVTGELKFTYIDSAGTPTNVTETLTNRQIDSTDGIFTDDNDFPRMSEVIYPKPPIAAPFTITTAAKTDEAVDKAPQISNISLQINYIVIKATGTANGLDYAKIDTVGALGTIPSFSGIDTFYGTFNMEVLDPRQNLNTGDWTTHTPVSSTGAVPGVGSGNTLGANNSLSDPFYDNTDGLNKQDWETVHTVVDSGSSNYMSTAYIRNDLMKSPWEIGAIHRGAAWQTLNIDEYSPGTVALPATMGSYDAGDANLLDQIKMTDDIELYGKFNVNATNKPCLRVLTMDIYTDNSYSDPTNTGGVVIDQTKAEALADAINAATDHQSWMRRSELLKTVKLSDGSIITQDTDAQKEEIIGKFINLCKTSSENAVTADVVIIAQAIKDIGDVTIKKDLDYDGALTGADETSGTGVGYDLNGDNDNLDATVSESIDTITNRYDLNGDEILSEAKILAKIYYDTTQGKWRVSKYIFADE